MNTKTNYEEIYYILEKSGVTKNECKRWIDNIHLERRKTEAVICDLFLCVAIKHGLKREHILAMSKILGHYKFRSKHIVERVNYLKEYIVDK